VAQDSFVPEPALIGHAIAGQIVTMPRSIRVIVNATVVLIIEVDVPNRILVGSISRAPKDQRTKTMGTPSARTKIEPLAPDVNKLPP
jgi:hypothetical protein